MSLNEELLWEPGRPYSTDEFQYSEILPGRLWLGEAPRTKDLPVLRALGITDIVNLTPVPEIGERARQGQFTVHHFPFTDGAFRLMSSQRGKAKAQQMMCAAAGRLGELMDSGRSCYLHCMAGISRSPTVLIMWMLRSGRAASFRSALEEVSRKRPIVRPNPELVALLREEIPTAF